MANKSLGKGLTIRVGRGTGITPMFLFGLAKQNIFKK
jgi:hypothetical protein